MEEQIVANPMKTSQHVYIYSIFCTCDVRNIRAWALTHAVCTCTYMYVFCRRIIVSNDVTTLHVICSKRNFACSGLQLVVSL